MSNSDILLHDNQIEVVPTDGGGLTVATAEGADPDAILRPNWATLTLGGGDGDNSDGDIKLRDRDGNTRIHIDGEGNGPKDPQNTQIWLNGRHGKIEVGKGPRLDDGEGNAMGEIEIWGNYSGDNPGQADIRMRGASPAGDARIGFWQDNTEALWIEPDFINMNDGSLGGADTVSAGEGSFTDTNTVTLEAGAAISPPGDDTWAYEQGEITVYGRTGDEDDQTETVVIEGQPTNDVGGAISLNDDRELKSVEIRGGNASIRLGGAYGSDVVTEGPRGRPGKMFLHDAASKLFQVKAEDGVFTVRDFQLNDTLFEIDTDDQTIRTKYSIDEGSL